MSMILDALRRAEAERERGAVPGLQSQQHALIDDDEVPRHSRALTWTIAGLVLALVLAVAWNFIGGEPPRPAAVATAPVVAPAPAAVATAPLAAPAPAALAPALTPTVVPSLPPPAPATVAAAMPVPPAASRPVEARRAAPRTVPAAMPAPADAASRAAADTRIHLQAELPDTVRRELPKVAIGGASYSGDKASRMVIINGQIFHEGDTIASGLVLQQIKLKAAVLAYKGWRYQIDF